MTMRDQKVEIAPKDWPELRDLYDFKSDLAISTLDNYIRWMEKETTIENLSIYCLNGDWSDGTFVVVVTYQQ